MNKLILSLLLIASPSIYASDPDWLDIAATDTTVYSIKKKSVTISETVGGVPVVIAVGRSKVPSTNQLRVFQMYVPVSDCKAGGGTFVMTDMSGSVINKVDFVYGLGNIAAELAEVICDVSKPDKSNVAPKSINRNMT